MHRILFRLGALLAFLMLAGCAAQPIAPARLCQSPLAVLPMPTTVGDSALRHVLHDEDDKPTAEVLAADRVRVDQSLLSAVQARFASTPGWQVLPMPASPLPPPGQPLDTAALAGLQKQQPAAAYLRLAVSDYGETPERWKGAYITFEVVSTLAIAGGLATQRITRPLAGAYLLEESVEELSEGYAGFWLFNRLSRPVRVQADLIDGSDGHVLWQASNTGMAAWHWANVWHMDNAKRDMLLQRSQELAVKGVVNKLRFDYLGHCNGPVAAPLIHSPGGS